MKIPILTKKTYSMKIRKTTSKVDLSVQNQETPKAKSEKIKNKGK